MENNDLPNTSNESSVVLLEEINQDLVNADNVAKSLTESPLSVDIQDNVADLTQQITTEEKEETPVPNVEQNVSTPDKQDLSTQSNLSKPVKSNSLSTTTVTPQAKTAEMPSQQPQPKQEIITSIKPNNLPSESTVPIKKPVSAAQKEISNKTDSRPRSEMQQPYDFKALEERLDEIGKRLPPPPLPSGATVQNTTGASNALTKKEHTQPRTQKEVITMNTVKEQTMQTTPAQQTVQQMKPAADNTIFKNNEPTVVRQEAEKNNSSIPASATVAERSTPENNVTVVKETNLEKMSVTNNTVNNNNTIKNVKNQETTPQTPQKQMPAMPNAAGLSEKLKKELAHLPEPPNIYSTGDIKVNSTTALEPFSDVTYTNADKQQLDANSNSIAPSNANDIINNTKNIKNVTVNEKNKDLPNWVTDPIKKPDASKTKTTVAMQDQPSNKKRAASTDATSRSFRTIFNTINNLPPEFDAFNLKSSIERGIREVAIPAGEVQGLNELLNTFPSGRKTINPSAPESPVSRSPRLSLSSPYQPYNIAGVKSQNNNVSNLGANEKALMKVNKNLDMLSTKVQQTYQLLSTSMQALNNTATEILRTMPSLAANTGRDMGQNSYRNKSSFTPTESKSLIGTYRNALNLTPKSYVNNTTLPVNGIS